MIVLSSILLQLTFLRPDFSVEKINRYANEITAACSNHKIRNCGIFVGILMTESSLTLNAVNQKSKDYGIGQVNEWHIKKSGLDKKKLISDLTYSLDASAKIWKWFEKTYPVEEAIGRYNCGTKKGCINWKSVIKYRSKVMKYSTI